MSFLNDCICIPFVNVKPQVIVKKVNANQITNPKFLLTEKV